MEISKPSWLRNWLNKLNWDIFVWKVYVGDAIEGAIDWVIDKVNLVLGRAEAAYNKALEAWDYARELANSLGETINREVQDILARSSTWWDQLAEWWQAKRSLIQDLIDAGMDKLRPAIDQVRSLLAKIDAAWDSFRRDTLPSLLSMDYWTAFWGGRVATISDWWAARRQQIDDAREAALKPVRDEVNKHSTKLDLIKDLFTDPEKWLLDRIESMIARFL